MKIVIIGYGGHYGSAVEACVKDPSLRLCGVAPGFSGESCQAIVKSCEKAGLEVPVFEDWNTMVDQVQPDIAVVCPQYHLTAPIAAALLKQGVHVFSEKPCALNLPALAELETVVRQSQVQYSAMLTYYYDPCFVLAKQLLDQGTIGEIRLAAAQKSYRFGSSRPAFYKDPALYGGTLPWVGIHAFTWIHWFTGLAFEELYAQGSTLANRGYGQLDMTCTVTGRLENQVLVNIGVDYLNTASFPMHGDDRIRLAGTSGTLEILKNEILLYTDQEARVIAAPAQKENIFAAFVRQIRTGEPMRFSAQDCFAITRAALLAQQSREEGRPIRF